MTLLLDVGNTRLKWARYQAGGLSDHGDRAHGCSKGETDAESAARVATALDCSFGDRPAPPGVVVSNVAGEGVGRGLSHWMRTNWQCDVEFVSASAHAFGVNNAYAEPETLGPDRWCTLVAVRGRFDVTCCVVDCGTAVTIDALTADGNHLGGLILPGLGLMRHSLEVGTHRLGVPKGDPRVTLARDTAQAIAAGTLHAVLGAITRVAGQLETQTRGGLRIVLTGGDAGLLQSALDFDCELDPSLVLKGLARIAEGKV